MEADGLQPRCDFVPPERANVDRPFSWQVPKPVAVRGGAVLWGELHCGDGVGEGLFVGGFLCGCWGQCLGHLVVRLLWGFRFLQFCADGGKDVLEGGGGGELGCWIVPGDVVLLWAPRVLLYGDVGGGVVFWCPPVRIVVEGVEGDGVAQFPAVECKEGAEAVSGVPGRAGVGRGCRFQEGVHGASPGIFPEKVVLGAPLVVVPYLLPPPLEGRVVRWELSLDGLVVLFGVHGVGQGAGYCGVDVLWGGGGARAWLRGRVLVASVPHCGPRRLRGI